jgi:two-component system LytT family response regulator
MKIKSIILDDEQHCVDTLEWQLIKYVPEVEITGIFTSPIDALAYLNNNKVDLLFLDIEMPGMNGFELLKKLKNINLDVVFTTAYDEFAVKAFKASAIDYLLKPINKSDLISAVKKVSDKQQSTVFPEQMEIFFDAINNKNPLKERIAVSTQEGLLFIKVSEIMYCISDSNYTYIHLDNNKKILVSKTLKDIESMLIDEGFLRIHNSNLINLQKIEKYIRGDGGYVIMDDNKSLNVSRSKKDQLLAIFGC